MTNNQNKPRNVFIDLGAGSGDDIKGYFALAPENKTHEVFAFEVNPARIDQIKKRYPTSTVYNAAAGIYDGAGALYLGQTLNGSSLNSAKRNVTSTSIVVTIVDLCKWLKDNFTQDDNITMVMDIEGAEYELLGQMIKEDLWPWIDQFYVEFHGPKIANFDMGIERNYVNQLIDFFGDRVYIYQYHQHEQFCKLNHEGL